MKKIGVKLCFVFFFLILLFWIVDVVAEDEIKGDEIIGIEEKEGNCDEYCSDFWSAAMPECPGDYIVGGEYPECTCEWICDEEDLENDVYIDGLKECRDKCKEDYDSEDERSKCISGCKSDFGFVDIDKEECESLNQEECELTDACEGVFGPSHCEGEVCTSDYVWKGCRAEGVLREVVDEYKDEILTEKDAGLTPDSPFYFLDGLFDSREEKIAEIKIMIRDDKFEEAGVALDKYREYAKEFVDEADPEGRDEARRVAAAIFNTLDEIEDEIPEDEKEEFYEWIIESEEGIVTAVEISAKIRDLCEQLAGLDPVEYEKVCSIDNDAPEWRKKKHKEWTKEQRKEAEEFGKIMKECFKSSGRECRCEDISFYDFSIACEKASAYAVDCDEGDKEACLALDELEMPELPEHLQEIFDEIEAKETKYELHMPYECVEAGAKTPKECSKIMIEVSAPEECKKALLDSGCESEWECRKICDRIMMDKYAPKECVEGGITDPEECGKFMDKYRRPEDGPRDFGHGRNCLSIEDDMKRLKCFEEGVQGVDDYYGPKEGVLEGEITWQCKENRIHWPPDCKRFMDEEWPRIQEQERGERTEEIRKREKECADKCDREGKAWDFTGGSCRCFEGGKDTWEEQPGEDYYNEREDKMPPCDNCAAQCPGASGTGCGPNGCECYYDSEDRYDYFEESDDLGIDRGEDSGGSEDESISESPSSIEDGDSSSDSGGDSGGDGENSGDAGKDSGDAGITGDVIRDNKFLEYYFRK